MTKQSQPTNAPREMMQHYMLPPKELETFFDNPPLVGAEQRSDYDVLFSAVAMAEMPSDAIDSILLNDYVGREWEIRRERQIKAEIIKFHQREIITDLLNRRIAELGFG
jgi:hypothetical protein